MITIDEIRERIEHESRGKLPEGVTISANTAIKDLGLSSLQISEVVFGLEEDHNVEFDAARAADAVTLGDLLTVANQALAEKHGSPPEMDPAVTHAPSIADEVGTTAEVGQAREEAQVAAQSGGAR